MILLQAQKVPDMSSLIESLKGCELGIYSARAARPAAAGSSGRSAELYSRGTGASSGQKRGAHGQEGRSLAAASGRGGPLRLPRLAVVEVGPPLCRVVHLPGGGAGLGLLRRLQQGEQSE